MSCTRFPLIVCSKQENNSTLYEFHYSKGDNGYFFYKILDYIRANRCTDCITELIQYYDLSYEEMKKDDFTVWFTSIKKHRLDVLIKLLEYGCERYSEYRDSNGADSYLALFRTAYIITGNFTEILELFMAAGIPVLSRDGNIITFLEEDCKGKINIYRKCAVSVMLEKYREK